MIVVDASVAVKWFLEEPGSEAAGQLLEGKEGLTAPQLIRLEVAGAFTRRARAGQLESSDAQRLWTRWFDEVARGVLSLVDDAVLLPAAVAHALALRHPLQDCLYLALAEELGAPLVTSDRRLAERAPEHFRVRLLGA